MVLTCGDNASAASEKLSVPLNILRFPSLHPHQRRGVITQHYYPDRVPGTVTYVCARMSIVSSCKSYGWELYSI